MRILLTNDDGIAAAGLEALERIARTLSDDIWIVAPEQEQSGASHSLSLHSPVRVRRVSERCFAASGTPTDCVLLAMQEIIPPLPSPSGRGKGEGVSAYSEHSGESLTPDLSRRERGKRVDLILSGVNRGSNAADDVTYSGTIAGAMEGTILGVPSMALSLACEDRESPRWETAEKHAPALVKKLFAAGWPANSFINLNFPDCAPGKVKGTRLCAQGKRRVNVALTGRVDPKGRPYFWIGGDRDNTADKPGVDIDLLSQGYITVTPLGMDLTDYKTLAAMQSLTF